MHNNCQRSTQEHCSFDLSRDPWREAGTGNRYMFGPSEKRTGRRISPHVAPALLLLCTALQIYALVEQHKPLPEHASLRDASGGKQPDRFSSPCGVQRPKRLTLPSFQEKCCMLAYTPAGMLCTFLSSRMPVGKPFASLSSRRTACIFSCRPVAFLTSYVS
jgi:hypothetical protein